MKLFLKLFCILGLYCACSNLSNIEADDNIITINDEELEMNESATASVEQIAKIIKDDSLLLKKAMRAGTINYELIEKDMVYNQDSILLFKEYQSDSQKPRLYGLSFRGIDMYRCTYDNVELKILLENGFMSGNALFISVINDSVCTKLFAYGCGIEDFVRFITTHQEISFQNLNFNATDSIIGQIHFEAVPDMKDFCELIKGKDCSAEWLETVLPEKVAIKGYFKLNKFDDFTDASKEYNTDKLFQLNREKQVYKTMDSIRIGLVNTIDATWAGLSDIPAGMNELQGLEKLNFHFNRFEKDVFEDLSDLHNLTYLNLSSNRLKAFPLSLLDIKSLKNLDISFNKISHYPVLEIAKSNIETIKLDNEKLSPAQRMLLEDKLVITK